MSIASSNVCTLLWNVTPYKCVYIVQVYCMYKPDSQGRPGTSALMVFLASSATVPFRRQRSSLLSKDEIPKYCTTQIYHFISTNILIFRFSLIFLHVQMSLSKLILNFGSTHFILAIPLVQGNWTESNIWQREHFERYMYVWIS